MVGLAEMMWVLSVLMPRPEYDLLVDARHGFDDGVEGGGGDGEVIGKGAVCIAFDAFEEYEEGVVAESKKERGERAPLLDPPVNSEGEAGVLREDREDTDMVKEGVKGGDKPCGGLDFAEEDKDKVMINRIKGLGRVEEEDVVLGRRRACLAM